MEILTSVTKSKRQLLDVLDREQLSLLTDQHQQWTRHGTTTFERLFGRVLPFLEPPKTPGLLLGILNQDLKYRPVLALLQRALQADETPIALLADRLDEGFRPEDVGVAFVNGIVSAATDLTNALPQFRPTIFLRDNILRTIQQRDQNYTRNIEGQLLRLHWSEEQLLCLVARRLEAAFPDAGGPDTLDLTVTRTDQARWNRHTTQEYRGPSGFRKVLQLTLYRPRDLITLLNSAFFQSAKRSTALISPHDVEVSADEISRVRLEDLLKEYSDVIPGLREIIDAVTGGRVFLTSDTACAALETLASGPTDPGARQTVRLYGVHGTLHELHSIGFIGYKEKPDARFTFCHDGRLTGVSFGADAEIMVHPCYWRALGVMPGEELPQGSAENIHDDYDERYRAINVTSVAADRRREVIQRIIDELGDIPVDEEHDGFCAWAAKALGTLLSGGVRDLERAGDILHGRITSTFDLWGSIQDEFATGHLLFLVRNDRTLTVGSITDGLDHAKARRDSKLVFICTRAETDTIRKGPELDLIRQAFKGPGVVIAHVTGKNICRALGKLRDPTNRNEPARFIRNAIDLSVYSYSQGVRPKEAKKRRRQKQPAPVNRIHCDMLLVVATGIERDALLDAFQNHHGCSVSEFHGARHTYFRIGSMSAKIFLVQSEMGSGGVGASLSTVRDAITEVNPENIVMTGIAFGLRPDQQEIGQILVSTQIMAYEHQRLGTAEGSSSRNPRGDRPKASARLLSRFRAATYGSAHDVHFGLILSGEKLVDNKATRDSLLQLEPEAIGGEMEGAGLHAAASDLGKNWIIVKAICDWADGEKSVDKASRQTTAATNAAAFVAAVIAKGGFSRRGRRAQ
ncbi:MAG: 5'-methylthioadenosine/S-adenosylhomocysteine nucleosidase [Thermoanaerobaculia bacterium]|nr:5'-methylthioadenosine/S-adenosylhomocysteine nucleosidase [Thermoanaerobaculia bacterium]